MGRYAFLWDATGTNRCSGSARNLARDREADFSVLILERGSFSESRTLPGGLLPIGDHPLGAAGDVPSSDPDRCHWKGSYHPDRGSSAPQSNLFHRLREGARKFDSAAPATGPPDTRCPNHRCLPRPSSRTRCPPHQSWDPPAALIHRLLP